ncbi:hypothetical protein H5410_002664 [Solanum commersonii]|uniref:DUF7746 domain-containing protein n=1 Tax=Solanum commersonii TaxID=4109 RepID=A0A9J6B2W8_SOLCO|nr:hypothetical protein H5410_002664 [Solanum commersonii]
MVHRMLMYATICNSVKNTNRVICKMNVEGFTSQLREWWDNYLSREEKTSIFYAVAIDAGIDNLGMALVQNREDAVYTLVMTILENFNSRFTNQHETIRILLNWLRCQTLAYFRWYKDTYLSGVMELLENKVEYLKAKFRDGLPLLFTERVRKTLRGSQGEIPYVSLSYGKNYRILYTRRWISYEKPLNWGRPSIKKSVKLERALANLKDLPRIYLGEISERLNKLKLYSLMITATKSDDYKSDSVSNIELFESSDNDDNHVNLCHTCQGQDCHCEDDEIYKLQLQFEDFNMNTITSDYVIELLKEIADSKLCEKIINLATSNEASSSTHFENQKNDLNDLKYSSPYSLKEVDDHLLKRNAILEKDSTFDDLNIEVQNLKKEIKSLKQNQMINDHRITQLEMIILRTEEPVNPDPKQNMFLGMSQIVTAHKWYATSGHALDIKYKLPNGKICLNKFDITHLIFLVKNHLNPSILLGTPFINVIYPFTSIDSKGFSATYQDNEITYSFVTDPLTRDINSLINMKQNHMDSLQMELYGMNIFESLMSAKVKAKIKLISEQIVVDICADHPRKRTLINKKTSSQEESSSSSQQLVNLEDIPKESPLYSHIQSYLEGKKQKDTFV